MRGKGKESKTAAKHDKEGGNRGKEGGKCETAPILFKTSVFLRKNAKKEEKPHFAAKRR